MMECFRASWNIPKGNYAGLKGRAVDMKASEKGVQASPSQNWEYF